MSLDEKNRKRPHQAAYARFAGVMCGVAITSALVGTFQIEHGVFYIIIGGSLGLGSAFGAWLARRAT